MLQSDFGIVKMGFISGCQRVILIMEASELFYGLWAFTRMTTE